MSLSATPETPDPAAPAPSRTPNRLREVILPGVLFLGDALSAIGGLVAGYGMRYHTPISEWGLAVPEATLRAYVPLLSLGAAMLLASYMYLGLYDPRLLLRRIYGMSLVMKALAFWLVAYLCVSLVLRFEPPISRLFVLVAFGTTFVITYLWRSVFHLILTRPGLIDRLKQRVAIVGTDENAHAFAADVGSQPAILSQSWALCAIRMTQQNLPATKNHESSAVLKWLNASSANTRSIWLS